MSYLSDSSASITVYILENNHLAAQYLLDILSLDSSIDAKITHDSSFSASNSPCILLMDQVTFLRCAQKLKILFPVAKILLIGHNHGKKQLVPHVPQEITGFIAYSEVAANLVDTVQQIWRSYYSGAGADSPDVAAASSPAYYKLCEKLTKREIAVVELMKHRLSNKEIATVLDISEATVKFHVTNIFAKTKVSRRRELFSIFQEMASVEGDRWAS